MWVVWNLRGRDENVNGRSRVCTGGGGSRGGDGAPESSGLAPLSGVPCSLGLAMVANLENGLFGVSLGGVVRGVAARDCKQGEPGGENGSGQGPTLRSSTILFKGGFPLSDLEGW